MSHMRDLAQEILTTIQANTGLWAEVRARGGINITMSTVIPDIDRMINSRVPGFNDRWILRQELASLIRKELV